MHAILIPARPAGGFCPTFYQEKVGENKTYYLYFFLKTIALQYLLGNVI
jgi:hypothetical protein